MDVFVSNQFYNLYGLDSDQHQVYQSNCFVTSYLDIFIDYVKVEQIDLKRENKILNNYFQEHNIQNINRDLDGTTVDFVQISQQNEIQSFKIILKSDMNIQIISSFCKYNGQPFIIQKKSKRVLLFNRLLKINFKLIEQGLRYSIDPIYGLLTLSATLHQLTPQLFEKYIQLNLQINSYYKKLFLNLSGNQIERNLFSENVNVIVKEIEEIYQNLGHDSPSNIFIKYGQYLKIPKIKQVIGENQMQIQKQYYEIQVAQMETGKPGFCFFNQDSPIYYFPENADDITDETQNIFIQLSQNNTYFQGYSPYLLSLLQNENLNIVFTDKPTHFQQLTDIIRYKEFSLIYKFVILYQIAYEIWHLDTYAFQISNLKIEDIIVTNGIIKIISIQKIQVKNDEQKLIDLKDFKSLLEIMYTPSINQIVDNFVFGLINRDKGGDRYKEGYHFDQVNYQIY